MDLWTDEIYQAEGRLDSDLRAATAEQGEDGCSACIQKSQYDFFLLFSIVSYCLIKRFMGIL